METTAKVTFQAVAGGGGNSQLAAAIATINAAIQSGQVVVSISLPGISGGAAPN